MTLETSVLRDLQDHYGSSVNSTLEFWLSSVGSDAFPGMMRYQLGSVDEHFRPTGSSGGKRFRPLLCLLSCDSVGGVWREALPVAAGIELLHNFSLIHDDIEDRDPERRHRPTVWKLWGEPQAINAGDGMFALATRAVLSTRGGDRLVIELGRAFQDMALELTRGQYLDMSFEMRQDVTAAEYMEMISLKSAAIIRFSAWAGAQVADAPAEVRDGLASFGESLGKAFQIADDIQGIWGTPQRTGKEQASDVRNRKKTLPVLLALEGATGADRDCLQRFYSGGSDDVDPVLRVLDETGVRRQAAEAVERYREDALSALHGSALSSDGASRLAQMVFELTPN